MKKNLFKSCFVAAMASLLFACNPDEQAAVELDKISSSNDAVVADVITFDNGATRDASGFVTSVSSQGGALISVDARQRFYSGAGNYSPANPGKYSADNRANLFNTSAAPIPPSDDLDLSAASETGNAMIINHNDNYMVPDDYAWGGTMKVDFSSLGTVTLNKLTYLDNEEGVVINLYGTANNLLFTTTVPPAANASKQIVDLGNTSNVARLELIQGKDAVAPYVPNGSGAIDDIEFAREVPETGCTRTQGYWKTHSTYGPAPYDETWAELGENTEFFDSGETYYSIFGVQPRGNSYYSLAHQYVAATLNILSGATMPTSVLTAYNQATDFFTENTPAEVAASKALKAEATRLAGILDAYNNGITGPGHCD